MKPKSPASFSAPIWIALRLKNLQAQNKNFCRVLDIRVAEIVDADLFHAAFPAAPLHLVVEIMLGHGENAALGVRFQPGGQTDAEELRQPD